MIRLRLLSLTTGLLMWATLPVWAEGPEFPLKADGTPACQINWTVGDRFNTYLSTSKGIRGPLLTTVPATGIPATTFGVPCPLVPGQYYMSVTALLGPPESESPPAVIAFVITDPNAPPPPVGFAVGATVKVTAPLIYVRASPSATGATLAFVGKGTTGIITEGPMVSGGQTWWKVQYTPTLLGWSAQAVLSL